METSENSAGVIKKDTVKLGEPRRVGDGAVQQNPSSGSGGARIVDKAPGLAIVEVTCTCGRKLQLNCKYQEPPGDAGET